MEDYKNSLEKYKKITNITIDGNNINLHPSNLQPHILGALIDNNWTTCFDYENCKIDTNYMYANFKGFVNDGYFDDLLDFRIVNFNPHFLGALYSSGWKFGKEPTPKQKQEEEKKFEEYKKHFKPTKKKNKIKKVKGYRMLPASTPLQKYMESLHNHIKEPHCKICGDTLEDGNLLKIQSQYLSLEDGNLLKIQSQYLCETCFDCQKSM